MAEQKLDAFELPPQWANGSAPLHQRLAQAIEHMIRVGDLPPGSHLPTERDLAQVAAVSRSTAAHAYRRLKADGHLESRQGSGTWVIERGSARGSSTRTEHLGPLLGDVGDTVDLALAVPQPPPRLRIAVTATGIGYEAAGLPRLRAAIAEHYQRRGVATEPDQILVTNGAQHALSMVLRHLVEPGGTVAVEEATYVGVLDAVRTMGARLAGVPVDREGIDVEALAAVIDRRAPSLVYLNPTHHTPTGTVLSVPRRRRLVRLVERSSVPLVDDTTLADLAFDRGSAPPLLAGLDRSGAVVTLGSLSKVIWAGLRVGWIRADTRLIEELVQRRMVDDLAGSVPSQQAAIRLVEHLDEHAEARAELLAARHRHLLDALAVQLPDWTVEPAHGGTVVWAQLPDGADAESFSAVAAAFGVNVVAGSAVTTHAGVSDRVRLAFVATPEVIDEGVRRLGDAWQEYRNAPASRWSRTVLV